MTATNHTVAGATGPRVALIGGGVIGRGWAVACLANNFQVSVYDPDPNLSRTIHQAVDEAAPAIEALGASLHGWEERLQIAPSITAATRGADFVQENGPERHESKAMILEQLDRETPASVVIASSTSTLMPSELQQMVSRHPARVLVGHPFNPVHLIPLVEVVGSPDSDPLAISRAISFYRTLGKRPVHIAQEVRGHVANRLQAALWREAYSLVSRGVATVVDIDAAIAHGPGLRWAVFGPFANQHLSGGEGGLRYVLEHLGPPTQAIMDDLGSVHLDSELVELLVRGVSDELAGLDESALRTTRDQLLVETLRAKAGQPHLP